jgi:hypothetical protein
MVSRKQKTTGENAESVSATQLGLWSDGATLAGLEPAYSKHDVDASRANIVLGR